MKDIFEKIKSLSIEKRAFIKGKYVEGKNRKTMSKKNSYNGFEVSGITACDEEDIDIVVQIARQQFNRGEWRNLSPTKKKQVMLRLAALMEQNKEELALLDTLDTGRAYKNYYEDSIPKAIQALQYFAESIDKIYDKAIPPQADFMAVITRQALGVVGIIIPWNDPMVVAVWKFVPALLMGNSVIIKPAEQSSLSLIKTALLAKEAGIPDGVFNVVPGYGEVVGKALVQHRDVNGIFFTGSSDVGKEIFKYAGSVNMKKIGLECGGKSPFLISSKCSHIEEAAKVLAKNVFYNQGQICSAPSRVIIDKNIKEVFLNYLKEECENYIPGNPFDPEIEVGCVVNEEQEKKIKQYIQIGIKEGADLYQAKKFNKMDKQAKYIQPTIFFNVKNSMRIAQEEIFGPVVVVIEVEDMKEAISLANDSQYGLAAAVWSDDIDEVYQIAKDLQAGLVHINSYGEDDDRAPFGGVKQSGIGKDKFVYAFNEYSNLKTTWIHFRN